MTRRIRPAQALTLVAFLSLCLSAPAAAQYGTVKSFQKLSDTQGGFYATLDGDDRFGVSTASLGDLDGDGVEDMAVGALGDDDGGTATGTLQAFVSNTAPVLDPLAPIAADEGDSVSVNGGYSDDDLMGGVDPATIHTVSIDWGDGTVENVTPVSAGVGSASFSGTHVYADDGSYEVRVTVTDNGTPNLDDFETITITVNEDNLDFGDAPDPTYPTLLASDGARHSYDPDTFLGFGVDLEPDGQPDGAAQGDDNNGDDDDEDGWSIIIVAAHCSSPML